MVFEILPVAGMYSILDMEIPFCATAVGFLCKFIINLRWVSYCKTWVRYFRCCCTLCRTKMHRPEIS